MDDYKGIISALQQLSKTLTKNQQIIMKNANISALDSFGKSLKKNMPAIYTSDIKNMSRINFFIDNERLSDAIKTQKSLMSELFIGKNYSQNLRMAFEQLQIPALVSLKTAFPTDMVGAITKSLIDCDYSSMAHITSELFKNDAMAGSDFATLKTTRIAELLKQDIDMPRGFISSMNRLNKPPAVYLSTRSGTEYNFNYARFTAVAKSGEEVAASASEMNVVCEGVYIINDGEDEFITEIELMELLNVLFESPSFAAKHPSAEKIKAKIDNLFNMGRSDMICRISAQDEYYHSRARERDAIPYLLQEMKKAPIGVTGPGRYTYPGRSYYYFCDTIDGAAKEVRKHNRDKVIQTVALRTSKDGILLDLSGTMRGGATFLKYIRFPLKKHNDKCPREYLIPSFVGECCRIVGFDGIKYYGGKEYNNYVTWEDNHFKIDRNV